MIKIKREHLGKQYEITVNFDEFNAIWISVSEVIHPTWKIFRTRYIDRRVKFAKNYECVENAVNLAFQQIMLQERKEEETINKIKEFEKKYLTKR